MGNLINTSEEIRGLYPIISNKSNTIVELNTISAINDLPSDNKKVKLILINSNCNHLENKYIVGIPVFYTYDNSEIALSCYHRSKYIISTNTTNNVNNSIENFPVVNTNFNKNALSSISSYTNGISGFTFPYKYETNTYNSSNINKECILVKVLSSADTSENMKETELEYSQLSWHKRLVNDGNIFNYYGKNINDIVFDYPIKEFNVYLDCSSGKAIIDDILNYIPKDLHQTTLNILIKPISKDTEVTADPTIKLFGFYNGVINISSYTSDKQIYTPDMASDVNKNNFTYNYFYLDVENCEIVNIKNCCNIYNNKNFNVPKLTAPLFKFKNTKYVNLANSFISYKFALSSGENSEVNQSFKDFYDTSNLSYKELYIKSKIKDNSLASLCPLIYLDNTKLLFENNYIGYPEDYKCNMSLVNLIANNNSTLISKNNKFNFNIGYYEYPNNTSNKCGTNTTYLNKRRIIFYSLNNSIINSNANDTLWFHTIYTTPVSLLNDYKYSEYDPSASILYGYASPGSFFNHIHYKNMLLSAQTINKNSIVGDLPVGAIYTVDNNSLNNTIFPANNGNLYASINDISSFGNIQSNAATSATSLMKYGISYSSDFSATEYSMFAITSNLDPTTIDPAYDYIFPLSNKDNRLSSKFSENLFYFQKYYSVLSKSEFITQANSKLFSEMDDATIAQNLSHIVSDIVVSTEIYNDFIPSTVLEDKKMLNKYSLKSYINKDKLITTNLSNIRS